MYIYFFHCKALCFVSVKFIKISMSTGFSEGREKEGSRKGRIRGEAVEYCTKGWFDLNVGLGKISQGVIMPKSGQPNFKSGGLWHRIKVWILFFDKTAFFFLVFFRIDFKHFDYDVGATISLLVC